MLLQHELDLLAGHKTRRSPKCVTIVCNPRVSLQNVTKPIRCLPNSSMQCADRAVSV